MQVNLSIIADYNEDLETVKTFLNAQEYLSIIEQTQKTVRDRLKYRQISDEERFFLRSLQDTLWIKE